MQCVTSDQHGRNTNRSTTSSIERHRNLWEPWALHQPGGFAACERPGIQELGDSASRCFCWETVFVALYLNDSCPYYFFLSGFVDKVNRDQRFQKIIKSEVVSIGKQPFVRLFHSKETAYSGFSGCLSQVCWESFKVDLRKGPKPRVWAENKGVDWAAFSLQQALSGWFLIAKGVQKHR